MKHLGRDSQRGGEYGGVDLSKKVWVDIYIWELFSLQMVVKTPGEKEPTREDYGEALSLWSSRKEWMPCVGEGVHL